jgi:hypothetical protein
MFGVAAESLVDSINRRMQTILGSLFAAGRPTEEVTLKSAGRLVGKAPRAVRVYLAPADWVEVRWPRGRWASKYWPQGIANL